MSPYIIVFGNSKGGTGKSTLAMHAAVFLLHKGFKVMVVDADAKQATLSRYIENRNAYAATYAGKLNNKLLIPVHQKLHESDDCSDVLQHILQRIVSHAGANGTSDITSGSTNANDGRNSTSDGTSDGTNATSDVISSISNETSGVSDERDSPNDDGASGASDRANGTAISLPDIVIIDTPGYDTPLCRKVHICADIVVTPINDSYIDLDLLAKLDEQHDILHPSTYAELVWEQRKSRAIAGNHAFEWLVVRNRLSSMSSKNKENIGNVLHKLSKRIGFKLIGGLGDRVIFRQLFLSGLTLLDMPKGSNLSNVAALQELRTFMNNLLQFYKATGTQSAK